MKTPLLTATVLFTLASAPVFAHHPAADRVDPEIYAMIDENVADTPHADMTFDDMGGAMEAREEMGESATEARSAGAEAAREEMSEQAGEDRGAMANDMEARSGVDAAMEAREEVDTMDLLDNVVSALSE